MEIINKLEKKRILNSILNLISKIFFSVLRLFIKKRSEGNVVIISLHKLGDTVFTIPAAKKIFTLFPEEKIYILTFKDSIEIYNLVFDDKNLMQLEKDDLYFGGRVASSKARKILNNLSPNIIFDLTGNISSALLIAASTAKRIIGMNQNYYRSIYSDFTPIRSKPKLMDKFLDVVASYTGKSDEYVEKEFSAKVKAIDKILVHPFAGWKAKEWNLRKYIELALKLKMNYDVEIIAPENEISNDIHVEIERNNLKVCITKSLIDLKDKIKECSLIISNDSGPIYIANVLGKATFSIYGPTNPNYSLPYGNYHSFSQKKISCSPIDSQYCFTFAGRYCPSNECMQLLSVDEVYQSVIKFIERINHQ